MTWLFGSTNAKDRVERLMLEKAASFRSWQSLTASLQAEAPLTMNETEKKRCHIDERFCSKKSCDDCEKFNDWLFRRDEGVKE